MNKKESTKACTKQEARGSSKRQLSVRVISFGHKDGPPPQANMVFDVRFLKNPYWVLELRPLTGLDKAVKDYVLAQTLAKDLIDTVLNLLGSVIPRFEELEIEELSVAFGCTGGQHRSVAIAELVALQLTLMFPEYEIVTEHRELKQTKEQNLASTEELSNVQALESKANLCDLKEGP